MAKRKGARQAKSAKTSAPRKAPKKKAARPVARKKAAASKKTSPASARRAAARKKAAPARKAAVKKAAAKKATRRAGSAKAASSRPRARALAVKRKTAAAKGVRRATRPAKPAARKTIPASERKAPSLNRNRRVVLDDDDDIVASPPSSLDMDRTASAARSGRKAFYDRLDDHPEVSPVITAGDVDADWESAYSVGDEAPGGDNPTPDQDIVDDIGRAVGNEYQDNEPLKGADKIIQRDKHRWELDPGSKEDFDEED